VYVHLGQLRKTPKIEEKRDLDIDVLEMAEPDNRNSGG